MLIPLYTFYYQFAADAVVAPPVEPPRIHSGAAVGMPFGGFNQQRLQQNKQDIDIVAAAMVMIR